MAIDVGYGQLHPRLRSDPRVTVLERVNARGLTELPFAPELVVCDVSFISVTKALPPVLAPRRGGLGGARARQAAVRGRTREAAKGVVRDPEVHRKVLRSVIDAARAWDAVTVGVVDSGLPGPKGNREFFVHLQHRPGEPNPDDSDRFVADAVA